MFLATLRKGLKMPNDPELVDYWKDLVDKLNVNIQTFTDSIQAMADRAMEGKPVEGIDT